MAYREEILDQSLAQPSGTRFETPPSARKWVGWAIRGLIGTSTSSRSIQSLHKGRSRLLLPPDHFDVVVVDEFHHAAAESYPRVLDHVDPAELTRSYSDTGAELTIYQSFTGSTTESLQNSACGRRSISST